MMDQGFLRERVPTLEEGTQTYYLAGYCRKLHKNERIWTERGLGLGVRVGGEGWKSRVPSTSGSATDHGTVVKENCLGK